MRRAATAVDLTGARTVVTGGADKLASLVPACLPTGTALEVEVASTTP